MSFCKDCRNPIVETDIFCENCGSKILRTENSKKETELFTVDQSNINKDSQEVINDYLGKVSQPQTVCDNIPNIDKPSVPTSSLRYFLAVVLIAITYFVMFSFFVIIIELTTGKPFHKTSGGGLIIIFHLVFFYITRLIWIKITKKSKKK